MPNFIMAYRGGNPPKTPEEGKAHMAEWQQWIADLGDAAVVPAQPLGGVKIVNRTSVTDAGSARVWSGYTIVFAADMDAALELAKGCPFLGVGGDLEVAELKNMPGM